jgi:hypothetical protein
MSHLAHAIAEYLPRTESGGSSVVGNLLGGN